jgi:AraC-like DNA-binding protein
MKYVGSKYHKKLLLYSILIGTIPILFLGVYSYTRSSEIIQKKVNDANIQLTMESQMRYEEILKSIQNFYTVLANNSSINDYLKESLTSSNYDSITEIEKLLSGMKGITSAVKSAYYINIENDWVVTNDGIDYVDEVIDKDKFINITNDSKNTIWFTNNENNKVFKELFPSSRNQIDNTYLIIKVPLNQKSPKGFLVVNLVSYGFQQQSVRDNDNDEMMVINNRYEVLLREGKELISNKDESTILEKLKHEKNQYGFYEVKINGKKLGVTYIKSKYNDWAYANIYSVEALTKDSRSIGFATGIICVIIVIFILIFSLFGTKIIYNPIGNIYRDIVNALEVRNSDRVSDEFKYIGEGISTLVKTRSQMSEQIKGQLLQLEEYFLVRLTYGELNQEEIEAKLKVLGYELLWKWLGIISIQIDNENSEDLEGQDKEFVLIKINEIVCQCIARENRFQPAMTNKSQIVLIGGNQEKYEEFKEYIYMYSVSIQKRIREELNIGVSIGISRPFQNLKDAEVAYKESAEALIYRIRLGSEVIIYFEDVQPSTPIGKPYPKKLENELIDAINSGDIDKSEELIDQLINEIIKEKLRFSEYQVSFMRLLTSIIGILKDSGESANILFDKQGDLYYEIYKLKTEAEIKRCFKSSVIKPVILMLKERRGTQQKNVLQEVVNMIHEDYDKDISLDICASKLKVHPNYIWRVMKKELDINFSDYLAQHRLKIAKQLLEETDMSVLEIAEKLRYNNSQNFIRYFKKLEGITPGQYRSSVKAE